MKYGEIEEQFKYSILNGDIHNEKIAKDLKSNFEKATKYSYLYHDDYWDGPLSGMCLIEDKQHYFNIIYEYISKRKRLFLVLESNKSFNDLHNEIHELFEIHVGINSNYKDKKVSKVVQDIQKNKTPRNHDLFYKDGLIQEIRFLLKKQKKELEVVSWFME